MRAATIAAARLAPGDVLAPERYDPARRPALGGGRPLGELVEVTTASVPPREGGPERVRVLDTGHARRGLIDGRAPVRSARELRSAKRRVPPGAVLVSRLRPYLQQVGWADPGLCEQLPLVASTEFVVLQAREGSSAFLVAYLLSAPVQEALRAAQQGGHHPRVPREALLELPVPHRLLQRRDEVSDRVEAQLRRARAARDGLEKVLGEVDAAVTGAADAPGRDGAVEG